MAGEQAAEPDSATKEWLALADAIRRRRAELDLRQQDLRPLGGPSHESIRLLESGEPREYRRATINQLERALRWKPGTVSRILDGTAGTDPENWINRIAEAKDRVQRQGQWAPPSDVDEDDVRPEDLEQARQVFASIAERQPVVEALNDALKLLYAVQEPTARDMRATELVQNAVETLRNMRYSPSRGGYVAQGPSEPNVTIHDAARARVATSGGGGKFEVYEDSEGLFRFRLKASNGQIVASGEAYETKAAAKKGCESVARAVAGSRIDDLTTD